MLRERNQKIKISFVALDLILSLIAFTLATALHFYVFNTGKMVTPDTGGLFAPGRFFGHSQDAVIIGTYFYLGLFISLTQVIVFIGIDLYHPRRGHSFLKEFTVMLRGIVLNLVVVLAILFFYRGTSFSRMVILYNTIFATIIITLGHYYYRKLLYRISKSGYGLRRVLLIGSGKNASRLVSILERNFIYGYKVVGVLGNRTGSESHIKKMIVGSAGQLSKYAQKYSPDLIIYASGHDAKQMREVIAFCDQEGIDCRVVPDFMDIITHRARIEDMEGLPILTIRNIPLHNGYNQFLKRLFDMIFSLSVIILLLPVFLLLAAIIKITSPGPIFFLQERVGLDRKLFKLIKFRTMRVQSRSESDTIWGSRNDARVTPIGNILRKTSLDEIPQFINVLLGNMSVVGPRPERPHFVDQFKSEYDQYMRRHSVKSGITGWAQIKGYRGDTSIQKRVELDIYYIENWSFWFDIAIILRTIPSMLKNPGE